MNNENLNQLLLDSLIAAYEKKGLNVQSILRNSLFMQLPLEAKITLLKNNLGSLNKAPSWSNSFNATKPLQTAALAGVTTGLGSLVALGYKPTHWQTPVLAGVVGAGLSMLPLLMAASKNYKKDLATHSHLANNKYMDALVARSDSTVDKPSPIKAIDILQQDFSSRLNQVDQNTVPSN